MAGFAGRNYFHLPSPQSTHAIQKKKKKQYWEEKENVNGLLIDSRSATKTNQKSKQRNSWKLHKFGI